MGYRIMQLKYLSLGNDATVVQGVQLERPYNTLNTNFGEIVSMYTPEHDLDIATIHDYIVEEMRDGYKRIKLFPSVLEEKLKKEEGILLIVPYAYVLECKDVKRIAGRYPTEGVFILKPNDKIKLGKSICDTEVFAAVQFERRMYMIKLHNE